MKILISILSLLVLPTDCNNLSSSFKELQKRQDTITITYEASSRGYFEEISVSNKSFTICNDITKKEYKSFECLKKTGTNA